MGTKTETSDFDDADVDEQYTDTSMFNAEEIVRNLEQESEKHGHNKDDERRRIDALRRAELRREQKRLEEELSDIDGFEIEDWDGKE